MPKKSQKMICEILIVLAGLFAILVLMNPLNSYYFFILQSFAYQGMLLFGVLLLGTVFLRYRYATIMTVIVLLVYSFAFTVNLQKSYEAMNSDGEKFNVLHINLARDNTEISDVMELIENENPEVLSLQELSVVNYEMMKQDLERIFSYQQVKPDDTSFIGLGLFSKFPLVDSKTIYAHEYPIFHLTIQIEERSVNLFALHTHAPFSRDMWMYQSDMFRALNTLIEESTGEVIVVGDLNAVPWHKEVAALIRNNNLKVAAYKPLGTFPVANAFIRVPIDHVLFSNSFQVLKTRIMEVPGSDHFGLSVDLQSM